MGGSKKGKLKRWDFDDEESWNEYNDQREAMPKYVTLFSSNFFSLCFYMFINFIVPGLHFSLESRCLMGGKHVETRRTTKMQIRSIPSSSSVPWILFKQRSCQVLPSPISRLFPLPLSYPPPLPPPSSLLLSLFNSQFQFRQSRGTKREKKKSSR